MLVTTDTMQFTVALAVVGNCKPRMFVSNHTYSVVGSDVVISSGAIQSLNCLSIEDGNVLAPHPLAKSLHLAKYIEVFIFLILQEICYVYFAPNTVVG